MAGYFDNSTGSIKIIEYSWDAINTNAETWADLDTWQSGSANYGFVSSVGVPDIEFFTNVIDFGRADFVNPLCSVDAAGDVNVKVFATETAPSDFITGDPVINAGTDTTLNAVYGRYFQYKVEVFSNSVEDAQLNNVSTTLSTRTQEESFNANSSTHPGDINMRYVPIVNTYSKILSLNGNAHLLATDDDSTYYEVTFDDESNNNLTLSITGDAAASTDTYKWTPASVRFNDNDSTAITDTNAKISATIPNITTGDFTLDGWIYVVKQTWLSSPPDFAHPEWFLKFGSDIYLRTATAQAQLRLDYSSNGVNWTQGPDLTGGEPADNWYYWRLKRESGTLKAFLKDTEWTLGSNSTNYNNATLEVGDLGTSNGNLYIDDLRVSSVARSNAVPGATFLVDSDMELFLTGATQNVSTASQIPIVVSGPIGEPTQPRYHVFRASGQLTDAEVCIHVRGLRKLSSDGQGNIVEG